MNSKLLAATLAASLFAACAEEDAESSAPRNAGINVLLVTIDTLRPDHMSGYGYPRPTSPSIDALASRGVAFDAAYTYWPKTRGSFAAMFTGLYSAQHGLTVRERDLPAFNETMAETFQKAGYRTAAAVDNGNLDASLGFAQGFDEYEMTWLAVPPPAEPGPVDPSEHERTELITEFGLEFLSRTDEERPFFLWLHYVNPHTPYDPPAELLERFRDDGVLPRGPVLEPMVGYHGGVNRHLEVEGATWGDYVDRYDAEILFADQHVGRVLDALEASPYSGTTLVVFTSDHGESLGEHDFFFDHGQYLFNPSQRIPLILSFPGFLPSGERVTSPVTTLDVFPTILDLAQVSFPPGLEGSSVLPLVRGTETRLHDQIFFQNDRHQIGLTNGRLKLILYPEGPEGEDERYELYHMYRDPGEEVDRYRESESIVAPLQAELSSFRTRTIAWQQETSAKRAGEAVDDSELSEAARRSLETLGYIDASKK